jgi:isopentenyl diphosphate isomerase/L-lactate dehydrogenase-like FMN-dependent dehydrogenase
MLKGIVTREDALLCCENGVDGIIVSNHGGRAEETGRSTRAELELVMRQCGARSIGQIGRSSIVMPDGRL